MAEGGYEKYFPLPGWAHSLELRARGGMIDKHVDPFFHLYAGGLPGMRGYSFYSLGGERTAVGTLTYRFPLARHAALNLWPLSLNRVYGQLFADVGNAWTGDFESADLKKDIGAGLRMQLHSFYSYPTAISFDLAYGLDKFSVIEDESKTDYGGELRYYLTLLFDFYSPFADNIPVGEH
jgi:outer membrane translocation and assembly module TamA